MNPKLKVILFDLDDTLISFDGVSDQAWNESCIHLIVSWGLNIDPGELAEHIKSARKEFWGNPHKHKIGRGNLLTARREIAALALDNMNIRNETLSNELADIYSIKREQMIHLFPNTISTLEKLRETGIRLGMITNGTGQSQRHKINRFGLAKYFDQILIEGEVGYGKPDIRIYKSALTFFDVSPNQTWMVGDNLVWDIEAPQSLGMYGIWHDYKSKGVPENSAIIPDRILDDISQLLDIL